ncbi:RNase A-like domain-containing protein [Candidatus Midichloria mitochondrii]|uniref:RNase A-like domain-containing protein n=1 Tax=Candidatus Midichloria mitochondrii TaxID=234827 RepID=UPI00135F133A
MLSNNIADAGGHNDKIFFPSYYFILALSFTTHSSFAADPEPADLGIPQINPVKICDINEEYVKNFIKDFNIINTIKKTGNHTSKLHVGKDYKELLPALEKKSKAVSSYYDQLIAGYVIKNGIQKDAKRIINWVNGPDTGRTLKLEYQLSKSV